MDRLEIISCKYYSGVLSTDEAKIIIDRYGIFVLYEDVNDDLILKLRSNCNCSYYWHLDCCIIIGKNRFGKWSFYTDGDISLSNSICDTPEFISYNNFIKFEAKKKCAFSSLNDLIQFLLCTYVCFFKYHHDCRDIDLCFKRIPLRDPNTLFNLCKFLIRNFWHDRQTELYTLLPKVIFYDVFKRNTICGYKLL